MLQGHTIRHSKHSIVYTQEWVTKAINYKIKRSFSLGVIPKVELKGCRGLGVKMFVHLA